MRVRALLHGVESRPLVLDLDLDFVRHRPHSHCCRADAGMARDVGQRLLHDPIRGRLHSLGEAAPFEPLLLEVHLDAALGMDALHQPRHRGPQPELVEHRRAQVEGEVANLADEVVKQRLGFGEPGAHDVGGTAGRNAEHQADAGQELADFVVQLARHSAALALLRLHEGERAGA
jgi:hypothetical protein